MTVPKPAADQPRLRGNWTTRLKIRGVTSPPLPLIKTGITDVLRCTWNITVMSRCPGVHLHITAETRIPGSPELLQRLFGVQTADAASFITVRLHVMHDAAGVKQRWWFLVDILVLKQLTDLDIDVGEMQKDWDINLCVVCIRVRSDTCESRLMSATCGH